MSPLAIHRATRRLRRHAAGVLAVLALGAIIGVHHNELAAGDMDHAAAATVVELCLGVFTAVGATVAAIAIALRSFGGWNRLPRVQATGVQIVRRRRTLEARAGPTSQALLRVWRH